MDHVAMFIRNVDELAIRTGIHPRYGRRKVFNLRARQERRHHRHLQEAPSRHHDTHALLQLIPESTCVDFAPLGSAGLCRATEARAGLKSCATRTANATALPFSNQFNSFLTDAGSRGPSFESTTRTIRQRCRARRYWLHRM